MMVSKRKEQELKDHAEELERSNRLKDLFIDILRHDLLNPTGVIKNIAEIMEHDENVHAPTEIEVIKRNVRKLEEIIDIASAYGKLEAEEEIEKSKINLKESIEGAIDELETFSLEKGIKINLESIENAEINASPLIDSIFINLISNAIKYSPEGTSITITIEDDGKSKTVSVADEGEGIADRHKENIFDRFTRKDKAGVKGTGLGLAIVKRIVDLHEGKVWVDDNKKGGSVFRVRLPSNT
jgi:signal transduction histidine kinase